jgi:hypothetical protein
MLSTTIKLIRASFDADPTINATEHRRLLTLIRRPTGDQPLEAVSALEPRLIRRAEAARRLSCSLRTVDKIAEKGLLRRRKLPGHVRASGFLESDLAALISG